jgi:hypothetical protein
MKTFLTCIAAATVLLAGVTRCFAGFLESQMIIEPDRTYVIRGAFKEAPLGSAFPTETLFSFEIQTGTSNVHEMFYFLGQTGNDTFEIRHTWATFAGFRGGKPSEETLKVDYKPDGEYPLPMSMMTFPGCDKKDLAVLKMVSLGDNQLRFRIIIPGCLEEALRKAKEEGMGQ